ncbi:MAG: DUF1566 domain-containing protein [Planctomycetes bacterium]|nr:DUF1566 domain-containing protein [Planctomycetota bacterium]
MALALRVGRSHSGRQRFWVRDGPMEKMLVILVVFGLGVGVGRFFDEAAPRAEAGGGVPLLACQDINGDGSSDVSDAIFFLNWRFLGGPAPTCPAQASGLPDTGQTTCYDASGRVVDCASDTCAGQDGAYVTGCPSEGRFVDNGDGTVTDTCTGLMWQKDTADTNGDGQVTFNDDGVTWCAALAYCENLSFAGHDDWRLPNVRELQSIVDYGRVDPAIDPVFAAIPLSHWSSTSDAVHTDNALRVSFSFGFVNEHDKAEVFYIRAVRNAR